MLKELLVGVAFAFALGALFAALSAAGSLLDTLIGFSFGALVDPLTGNQSSIISQVYALVGVLVFIAIGGDAWVIQGLARTYELVPLLEAPHARLARRGRPARVRRHLRGGLQVCAPVLLALVITDAAFGVVSRVVPAAQRLRRRLPGQGRGRPAAHRRRRCRSWPAGSSDELQRSVADRPPDAEGGVAWPGDDSTEKATPKKRGGRAQEGPGRQSADLNGAVVLLAALLALSAFGPAHAASG